jgi:pimeloyl-ACP methyl ester carboxylesterase
MAYSLPILPPQELVSGLGYIPSPSTEEFDAEFGGILPAGESITSAWGETRCYSFHSATTDSSTPLQRIILLHGGGTPAIGLAALAKRLVANGNKHVVVYDLWSHGLSSTPLSAHTPALFHSQILQVLLFHGWSSAHMLGFSIGGSILTTFASLHPGLVSSLVLVAPAGLLSRTAFSWLDNVIIDGGWGIEWLSRRKVMSFVNGVDPKPQPDWRERLGKGEIDTTAVEIWERDTHQGHVAGNVSIFRHGGVFGQKAAYKRLAETKTKAIIILGEKDQVVEPGWTQNQLSDLGWTGKVYVVDDATHALVRSHVDEVAKIAEMFWTNLQDGGF